MDEQDQEKERRPAEEAQKPAAEAAAQEKAETP